MKTAKILITISLVLSLTACAITPSQSRDNAENIESTAKVEVKDSDVETIDQDAKLLPEANAEETSFITPEFTYKEVILLPQYTGELNEEQLEFCEKLSHAIENGEESVDASMLTNESEINAAYYAYVASNPLYALVNWHEPASDLQTFNMTYVNDAETHKELVAEWHELIEKIMSSSISESESETMKNLYDYITVNNRYEYTAVDPLASDYTYTTSYLVLTENKGICETYSRALNYLLMQAGIECLRITSSDLTHAWVMAKIDGEWYNFDPTFDNCTMYPQGFVTNGEQVPNTRASYEYFGMSDELRAISWDGGYYYCTKQDWDSRQTPPKCDSDFQINRQ